MSYILDALRKADAQRERDPSRGIHAHPAPLGGSMRRSNGAAPWAWAAIAIAVFAVAGAAWYVTSHGPAPVATAAPELAVAPPAPAVQAPPVVVTEPAPPPPVAVANEISPPPARIEAPSRAPAGPPRPAMRTEPQPPPAAAAPATTGLPPDAPKVTISGGVYSPNVAQRMLIVNGQVFNEGSEVAPGLAIEKIEPRTAVLRFRGARYRVAY